MKSRVTPMIRVGQKEIDGMAKTISPLKKISPARPTKS